MNLKNRKIRIERSEDERKAREIVQGAHAFTDVVFQLILERSRSLVGGPNVSADVAKHLRADTEVR